jgi:ribosomal protein S18 acetylase RimI-like enzyme
MPNAMTGARNDDGITIRPAGLEDLAAVERLLLSTSPDALERAFGKRTADVRVEALVRLRLVRPDPTEGTLIARTRTGELAGFARYTTAEMRAAPVRKRIAALRPLGLLGIVRFAVVATLAFHRYMPESDEVYLSGIGVDPRFRRRGLALRLIQRRERETAARGYRRWTSHVSSSNAAARRLFAKAGYDERSVSSSVWRRRLLREPARVRLERRLS